MSRTTVMRLPTQQCAAMKHMSASSSWLLIFRATQNNYSASGAPQRKFAGTATSIFFGYCLQRRAENGNQKAAEKETYLHGEPVSDSIDDVENRLLENTVEKELSEYVPPIPNSP